MPGGLELANLPQHIVFFTAQSATVNTGEERSETKMLDNKLRDVLAFGRRHVQLKPVAGEMCEGVRDSRIEIALFVAFAVINVAIGVDGHLQPACVSGL